MTRYSRRTLLKAGAAFAGASAIGFPAILSAQAARIKIGHLVPLTGFLGAIGSYAQLGVKMAAEEINASGGIMGKQIDLMSEDLVNPATASTKAQRMIEQDGAVPLGVDGRGRNQRGRRRHGPADRHDLGRLGQSRHRLDQGAAHDRAGRRGGAVRRNLFRLVADHHAGRRAQQEGVLLRPARAPTRCAARTATATPSTATFPTP